MKECRDEHDQDLSSCAIPLEGLGRNHQQAPGWLKARMLRQSEKDAP